MSKCICELEVGEESNLDYTAAWSYLALKRKEDGYYLIGYGDDSSIYKANFCPCCGRKLENTIYSEQTIKCTIY